MNMNKKTVLLGLASSLVLFLTACDTQALNDSLNLSEEYNGSQESTENPKIIDDQLGYKESGLENEYSYEDLYVLNTGKLGAEIPKYYIVERITRYGTDIGEIVYKCEPKNCYYAEENLKSEYHCYAIVYRTIGLEEEQIIYHTSHYPLDFYGENIYLCTNDNLLTLESGMENEAYNEELFQKFDNSVLSISSVINPDDFKLIYTEAELIELMMRMNSEGYEFNEEYAQKLDK